MDHHTNASVDEGRSDQARHGLNVLGGIDAGAIDAALCRAGASLTGTAWLSLAEALLGEGEEYGGVLGGGVSADLILLPTLWRSFFEGRDVSISFEEKTPRYDASRRSLNAVYYYSRSSLTALTHEMAHFVEAPLRLLDVEDFGLGAEGEAPLETVRRECRTVLWQEALLRHLSSLADEVHAEDLRHLRHRELGRMLRREYLEVQTIYPLLSRAGLVRRGKCQSVDVVITSLLRRERDRGVFTMDEFLARWNARARSGR